MSKWTRTRRDPGRTYTDETTARTERMIARIRKFMKEGVPEDEPQFVEAVKAANPKIAWCPRFREPGLRANLGSKAVAPHIGAWVSTLA